MKVDNISSNQQNMLRYEILNSYVPKHIYPSCHRVVTATKRRVKPTLPEEEKATEEAPTEEATAEKPTRKDWKAFKNVVEATEIDKVDRLSIYAGVNEYKGTHLVFVAKVTDKDYQKAFFGMPAFVWEKALPVLKKLVGRIGDIEKKAMAEAVLVELKRLKELGIDVEGLAAKA